MCEQGVEQWAEDAPLGGASIENDDRGYGVINPFSLGSVSQEVQNPVAEFIHQCLWYDGVKSRAKI